jgi:hypothetical protein
MHTPRNTSNMAPTSLTNLLPAHDYSKPTKGDVKSHKELQHLAEMEISRRGVLQQLHLSDMTRKKKVGWPDSSFVYRGIPAAIEYKINPDKPSPDQIRVMNGMRQDGWRVFVCYSFGQVVEALNGLDRPQTS